MSFRALARNPQKNALSCWTVVKHLSLNAPIQEILLPYGRQNVMQSEAGRPVKNLIAFSAWLQKGGLAIVPNSEVEKRNLVEKIGQNNLDKYI